jgi:primosomal protein N'
MTGFGVARVAIDSPLPQLDRLFDYEIAHELRDSIAVGSRVRVPFGRGAGLTDGFVVELVNESEFVGKLARLEELVSPLAVLPGGHHRRRFQTRYTNPLGGSRKEVAGNKDFQRRI